MPLEDGVTMNYGGLEILGAEYYLWIVCSGMATQIN